jgi:uncharacterized membrane protein
MEQICTTTDEHVQTAESDAAEAEETAERSSSSVLLILTWVFAIMSVVGLFGETLQHYLAFGELESRAGFIWGPFSPIYGLAALLLTLIALSFDKGERRKSNLSIFLAAALVGGGLEYFASWAMETFWGIVAWSYLDVPFNFNGRTDLFHMAVWGFLGFAWVRLGWPLVKKAFAKINTTGVLYKAITWGLFVFLLCDACMTVAVMLRADARTQGIAPATSFEAALDEYYPNEVLQARFENMGGLGVK